MVDGGWWVLGLVMALDLARLSEGVEDCHLVVIEGAEKNTC
jgi:hypothetical protein